MKTPLIVFLACVTPSIISANAGAAVSLKKVVTALITGPHETNDYSGTTPDGSYNGCSASLRVYKGQLEGSLTYGDTGMSVRAALDKTAEVTMAGGLTTIQYVSDEFADIVMKLTVQNNAVQAMMISFSDPILFIPRTSTITCESLQQFIPKYP